MDEFLNHVKNGLSQKPKRLSSRYFYDHLGDRLFQQIMELEAYYLPECELDIIENKSDAIARKIAAQHSQLQIVELGAGDGSKTKHCLDAFYPHFQSLEFVALDISPAVLESNQTAIMSLQKPIQYKNISGDYFKTFPDLGAPPSGRLVMFLGANIGNFTLDQAIEFLQFIRSNLQPNDFVLVAFDLVKHPRRILEAYDDDRGITKDFNLNILARMNRELGANFDLTRFDHFPYYNPVTGQMRSHIISLEEQDIILGDGTTFHFEAWEAIHTEISKKYTLNEINTLATKSRLDRSEIYFDAHQDYAFVLFKSRVES